MSQKYVFTSRVSIEALPSDSWRRVQYLLSLARPTQYSWNAINTNFLFQTPQLIPNLQ
jgi:hypothetical protein